MHHLATFTAKASERYVLVKYWLKCSAESIGTDIACAVVAVAENCDMMYNLRCGASCKVRTPSKLGRLAV